MRRVDIPALELSESKTKMLNEIFSTKITAEAHDFMASGAVTFLEAMLLMIILHREQHAEIKLNVVYNNIIIDTIAFEEIKFPYRVFPDGEGDAILVEATDITLRYVLCSFQDLQLK